MKQNEHLQKMLNVRLTKKDYETFYKMTYLMRGGMAGVTRELILNWIEKNKGK